MIVSADQAKKYFLIIFALGVLARCYGITDHWKNNDHYNFGGAMMTHSLKCLRSAPLEVTRGLITSECDTDKPNVYVNYTPFFLWGMWLTTEIFGDGEWAHRLFFLIFSSLNILLVYSVAREIWPSKPRLWVFAGFFQSFFLSPMYLGTHMDPITEFTVTPMLVSTLLTLRGSMFWASLWALIAGLTTWIGYFQFLPLVVYSFFNRKNFRMVLTLCVTSAVVCFGSMMVLRQTWDILGFVAQKLTDPEYIRPPSLTEQLLLPVQLVRNFFQSLARLLGPLFAAFALYELIRGSGRPLWRFSKIRSLEKEQWAFVLTGLAFFGYMVPGFKYAMVHIHNYIFAVPMWALLASRFLDRTLEGEKSDRFFYVLIVAFIASYPFGIYQSSRIHDVINSLALIFSALAFGIIHYRRVVASINATSLTKLLLIFTFLTALGNFSQVMNYRNEADSEFPFCEKAREEYNRTGQPIHTLERRTRTKEFLYCRGIPIIYEGPEQGI